MEGTRLNDDDLARLAERGIAPAEASRQLELLDRPPRFVELDRPCTVGDGILRIGEVEVPRYVALHEQAAARGRFVKFVPASGAASRMFKSLLFFQQGDGRELSWTEIARRADGGPGPEADLVRFFEKLDRFAFHEDLRAVLDMNGEDLDGLARVGAFHPVLDALLGEGGLDYDGLPKGLLRQPHVLRGAPDRGHRVRPRRRRRVPDPLHGLTGAPCGLRATLPRGRRAPRRAPRGTVRGRVLDPEVQHGHAVDRRRVGRTP
jgi:hypothetical protein